MNMKHLVELDREAHRDCRVSEGAALRYATTQNVLQIQASEVGQAACSFPVFLTRGPSTGIWALAAVLSLEQGSSLFVENGEWTASYLPFGLQTYPLYLMKSPSSDKGYAVGVVGHDNVLAQDGGEVLFDEAGKESAYLQNVIRMLEANLQNEAQTRLFAQRLEQLELLVPINIKVEYKDGAVHTITGLHAIDEEKLRSLATAELQELNKNGYLLLTHAMLTSIFQLNTLIRKHNRGSGRHAIKQARLEAAQSAADPSLQ